MKLCVHVLLLLTLPLAVRSQTPEDDRKIAKDFELAFATKIDSVQRAPGLFRYQEGSAHAGLFGRKRCDVANTKFDVQKTSSLVTPYTAPISFEVHTITFGAHPDSLSALRAAPGSSRPRWVRVEMTYLWRDGVWRYSSGTARYLPSGGASDALVFKGGSEVPLWPGSIADDGGLSLLYRLCIDKEAWSSVRVK